MLLQQEKIKIGIFYIFDLNISAGSLLRVGGLARHLREFGCEPVYFSEFKPPPELLSRVKYVKLDRHIYSTPSSLIPAYPNLKLFFQHFLFNELTAKIQESSIDLLHCHGHPSASIALAIRDKINIPILFDTHGIVALQEKETKSNVRQRILYSIILKSEKALFRNVDFINVRSEKEKIWVSKYFNTSKKKIFVSPSGVEIPHPVESLSPKEKSLIRKEQGWEGKKIILFLGALKWISGLLDLIKAYEIIKKRNNDIILVIIGKKDYSYKALRQYIQKKDIKDVIFKGYLPYSEALRLQSACDVLIIPETSSEFSQLDPPLKTLEAMATGKPVICTRLQCYEGLLKNGENAVLVEAENPTSIAKGLISVLKNPGLALKISQNVRSSIPANRIWRNISKELVDYYKIMLKQI